MADYINYLLTQDLKQSLYNSIGLSNLHDKNRYLSNRVQSSNKESQFNQRMPKIGEQSKENMLKVQILSDLFDNAIASGYEEDEDEENNNTLQSTSFQLAAELIRNMVVNKMCLNNQNITGKNFFNNT